MSEINKWDQSQFLYFLKLTQNREEIEKNYGKLRVNQIIYLLIYLLRKTSYNYLFFTNNCRKYKNQD